MIVFCDRKSHSSVLIPNENQTIALELLYIALFLIAPVAQRPHLAVRPGARGGYSVVTFCSQLRQVCEVNFYKCKRMTIIGLMNSMSCMILNI